MHHVHSMHHSTFVYFRCCTLPPSTHLNHSQQQPSFLLCSAYLYYLCTFFVLHAQCLCMLFTVPWFYSLSCSLHSTFSLLRFLKPQKENCISLLSIPHQLLISKFYLTLRTVHTIIFPSLQFNSFSFRTTNHTQSLRVSFYALPPLQLPLKSQEQLFSN
jgi:hypothetical protein